MTPEERARIEKDEEDKIKLWSEQLSKEELKAWLEASINDLGDKHAAVEIELHGRLALVWIADHCQMPPLEALRFLRKKETLSLDETQALDAWDKFILWKSK